MDGIPLRETKGERREWLEFAGNASDPRMGAVRRDWGSVEKTEPTPGFGAGRHPDEPTERASLDAEQEAVMHIGRKEYATFSHGTYGNSRRTHP